MIKYGKTKQFSGVVRDIAHAMRYKGVDDNGEPIYSTALLPEVQFVGTVKIHGTNAGISWNLQKGLECMSRNNVVTQGHFGFPEMIYQEQRYVEDLVKDAIHLAGGIDKDETISIFGEWAGPGVQKGVAISEIPEKTWFLFAIKVTDSEGEHRWVRGIETLNSKSPRIRTLAGMQMYVLTIDMNVPALSQNSLVEWTQKVEDECPIAKDYDISGVGEGIVWEGWIEDERYIFKTKGDKHSSSKVKTLASVDPEKVKSVQAFLDYAVTENRVKQAMFEVSSQLGVKEEYLNKSHTGDVLRWVAIDVIVEEAETMKNSGIEWKDVGKVASQTARNYYFNLISRV